GTGSRLEIQNSCPDNLKAIVYEAGDRIHCASAEAGSLMNDPRRYTFHPAGGGAIGSTLYPLNRARRSACALASRFLRLGSPTLASGRSFLAGRFARSGRFPF